MHFCELLSLQKVSRGIKLLLFVRQNNENENSAILGLTIRVCFPFLAPVLIETKELADFVCKGEVLIKFSGQSEC